MTLTRKCCSTLITLLAVTALPAYAGLPSGSTVTTGGYFYQYNGPLGATIRAGQNGPFQDPATAKSYFRDVLSGNVKGYGPQYPYGGYEDPAFDRAGAGTVPLFGNVPSGPGGGNQFWYASRGVEFWNESGGVPENTNLLRIDGAVTSGVTIGPGGKSNVIKLATFTFGNGDWFGNVPPINPGNGELYPPAGFSFSIVATPDPMIGSSGFPGYHVYNDTLFLATSFGPNTPDYLYLGGAGASLGVVAVNEGSIGTVELWGRIGSLEPVEFRNPSAGVSLLAEIPSTPVPEPATYLQMLMGIGALLVGRRMLARR